MTPEVLGYAFIGGLLPSIIWLYFLLKEDSRCPEPIPVVTAAFFAGAIAVPLVLPIETAARTALVSGAPLIVAWAIAEETLKYIVAAVFILWRRAVDESPDYVIYMITVALGFAAAENALFLLSPLMNEGLVSGLVTGNLRFLGSTLLHVVASAMIGFAFAFSYNMNPAPRVAYAAGGLILAVLLHTAFNTLIIGSGGSNALLAFFMVWTAAVVFFAIFEVLKYVRYRNSPKNTC